MTKIETLIAKINKDFGDGTIVRASEFKHPEIKRLSTGSLFLDKQLGTSPSGESGWPLGRVIELYGPQMSGKSTLSMKTIVEAQKQGLTCMYFDAEKSFDTVRATTLGIDIEKLILSTETCGEKVIEMICESLRSKSIGVIVVDSLAALIPMAEIEKTMMDTNRMALVALMMSQGLRKLTSLNEQTLIIFINQLRMNPGQKYGNPEYTPGGRALGFYASVRVDLRAGDWIVNKKKEKIGNVVKFRITKNKTFAPHRMGFYKFMYSGEIDAIDELISIGLLNNQIKRKGAWFFLGNDENGFKGRENLELELKNDSKLFKQAKKLIFQIDT